MSTKGVRGANVCILKQTSFCIHHVQALTQTNVCFEALAVSMHSAHSEYARLVAQEDVCTCLWAVKSVPKVCATHNKAGPGPA